MSYIDSEKFKSFWKWYKAEPHQVKAIEKLYSKIPLELLDEESEWIRTYRDQIQEPDPKDEYTCVTKQHMASIMGCAVSSLPDSLMEDYYRCCRTYKMDKISQAYFLGQVGHESGGLRYPLEIHDGSNYELRHDLGNVNYGDGVKYAGTGFIQVTGRYWHTEFSRHIGDPKVIQEGKQYTCEMYPWSISGFWWWRNDMIEYCKTHPPVDRVGQQVNGKYLPNGYEDRRYYSKKAFEALNITYPGD